MNHTIRIGNLLLIIVIFLTLFITCKDSNKEVQILISTNADITELYDSLSPNKPAELQYELIPDMIVEVVGISSDEIIGLFMPKDNMEISVNNTKTLFNDLISPEVGELFFATTGSKILVPQKATRLFFESTTTVGDLDTIKLLMIPPSADTTNRKLNSIVPVKTSLVQIVDGKNNEIKPSQIEFGSIIFIEVEYPYVPQSDDLEINFNWNQDKFELITVYRTQDRANLFRSKPIIINISNETNI